MQPNSMFANLKKRVMRRKSHTRDTNCIDISYNTTSASSISRSIELEGLPIHDSDSLNKQHKHLLMNHHQQVTTESNIVSFQPSSANVSNQNNGIDAFEQTKQKSTSHEKIKPQSRYIQEQQVKLIDLAKKYYREGEIGQAIKCWERLLYVVKTDREWSNLSSVPVTEILCMLVDLHHQESKRLEDLIKKTKSISDVPLSTVNAMPLIVGDSRHGPDLEGADTESSTTIGGTNQQLPCDYCFAAAAHHKSEAQRYVLCINSAMVQPTWLRSDPSLMEFLYENEAWELALIIAIQLSKNSTHDKKAAEERNENEERQPLDESSVTVVNPQKIAMLHYRIASLKTESGNAGQALQHLQSAVANFQKVPLDERDVPMFLHALDLLAAEFKNQGRLVLALNAYKKKQNYAPPGQCAHISFQIAEIYKLDGQFGKALEELESAYDQLCKNGTENCNSVYEIRFKLLQNKGEVYYHLGQIDDCIREYQLALQEARSPSEKAKLLFVMGRLSVRTGRVQEAVDFFLQELKITEKELGAQHISTSFIYHELAELYDKCLGLHNEGMQNYEKALQIELALMDKLNSEILLCDKCINTSHSCQMCDTHAKLYSQMQGQIRETKKSMGRIRFKLGDFDGAIRVCFSDEKL